MRKLHVIVLCCLALVFNACRSSRTASAPNTMSSDGEKNLAAYHVVFNAFKTGDVRRIDDVVAPDFVDHTERGDLGRDSLKAMIVMVHKTMPTMNSSVIKELADGEYVFSLIRYTGTTNGEMGMPPGPYDFKTMEVVRYKNGKAVEHWAYVEMTEMMKMMAPSAPKKSN